MKGLINTMKIWENPFTLSEGDLHVYLTHDYKEIPIKDSRHKPEKLIATRERIAELFRKIKPITPPKFDYHKAYQAVWAHYSEKGSLEGLRLGMMRSIPWFMFEEKYPDPVNSTRPLAANAGFLNSYLQETARRTSCNLRIGLAQVFLYVFPKDIAISKKIREHIPVLLKTGTSPHCAEFLALSNRYHLFESDAPAAFWSELNSSDMPIIEQLENIGFKDLMSNAAFLHESFREGLHSIRQKLETNAGDSGTDLNKLATLLPTETGTGLKKSNRAILAESLLLPVTKSTIPSAHQQLIKSLLLRHYSDPRLSKSEWFGIDQRAVEIMRSWLIQDSLETFFELLQHLVRNAENVAPTHWRQRKAFWSSYLKKEEIRDAWVILSRHLFEKAKRTQDFDPRSVGIVQGKTADHACLLMRIGNLVIIEWNYNGKCHIIEDNSLVVPEFYKRHYDSDELMSDAKTIGNSDLPSCYIHRGSWQLNISKTIKDITGISVNPSDFLP